MTGGGAPATTRVAWTDIPIIPLTRLDLRFEPAPWPFAVERRGEIDAHFAKLRAEKPEMWNGRVLLLRRGEIAGGTLSGAYLETDFASFIAWRDWGFPDKTMRNCFPMAALRSCRRRVPARRDGRPYGDRRADLFSRPARPTRMMSWATPSISKRGVMRELAEETGLGPADVDGGAGLDATPLGQRIALMKVVAGA